MEAKKWYNAIMIPTQKIYSFLISLLLALTPLTSSAQSSLEIEGDQPGIWVNDNLAIGDITVTSKTVDTIQGTFVIKNKSSNTLLKREYKCLPTS